MALPKWLYAEGIKQMIAHYLGVRNEMEDGFNNRISVQNDLERIEKCPATEFYLGIVLFDFGKENGYFSEKKESFATLYERLARVLNKQKGESRLHVVDKVLTYQEIRKSLNLSENTRKFYYGD